MEYETIELPIGAEVLTRTNEDGSVWYIPFDEANSDFQAYLAYLAEQETA